MSDDQRTFGWRDPADFDWSMDFDDNVDSDGAPWNSDAPDDWPVLEPEPTPEDRPLVPSPIRGWKAAWLQLDGGRLRFEPVVAKTLYDAGWADARCLIGTTAHTRPTVHGPVPEPRCDCGWYARDTPETVDLCSRDMALLEVELAGTVVVGERGYRAQRQRVRSVTLPGVCAEPGCEEPATVVGQSGSSRSSRVTSLCEDHTTVSRRMAWAIDRLAEGLAVPAGLVVPDDVGPSWTTDELAAVLGCDVAFHDGDDDPWRSKWTEMIVSFNAFDPPEPADPLERKRLRDEQRRQRLETLAGPRRAPRTL